MDCGVSLMLKFSPVAVLILPVVYEPVPSVVDRSALPVTFMVPRLSPSALCGIEFSALPLCDVEFTTVELAGSCVESFGAALLAAGFEAGGAKLCDAALARELSFCAAVSQNGEQSSAKESKILLFFIKILFRFYNPYQFIGGIILQFLLNNNKIFNKLNHKILYAITNLTEFNKIY